MDLLGPGEFPILPLENDELIPLRTVLRKYEDQRIDLADAALVHLAIRERIGVIFTFDRRHFELFRQSSGARFRLLPDAG